MAFRIERNDITKVHTDAIVNTANPQPLAGSGTDEVIYHAAGFEQLLKDREQIGVIGRGEAAATPAHNLFATNGIRYIIHTVGISWQDGKQGEPEIMRNCYRNSLKLAQKLGCQSVSIPLLATGNYGFPKETALNIALDEISKFLFDAEMEVVLVVYDKESVKVSGKIFEGIKSFIDENYVAERKNHSANVDDIVDREIRRQRRTPEANSYVQEKLRALSSQKKENSDTAQTQPGNKPQKQIASVKQQDSQLDVVSHKRKKEIDKIKSMSASEYISKYKNELNFQDLLMKHIKEKDLKNSTVYKKSRIVKKKYFYKIINGMIPSKPYVIALGLALQLDLEAFEEFLAAANFAFNPSDKFDRMIKYCVINKRYNIVSIDVDIFMWNESNSDKMDNFFNYY